MFLLAQAEPAAYEWLANFRRLFLEHTPYFAVYRKYLQF
jgi:hypothetical protein